MQVCLIFIRSITFYFISFLATCLLFLPALVAILVGNTSIILFISKLWARLVINLLEYICGLRVRALGLEHLKNQPLVIASKHQSALETLFIYTQLAEAKYVLKSSLKFLPFLGICFSRLEMIFIDRKAPISSIRAIKEQAKRLLSQGKSIIIFPEGTRVPYGSKGKYSPGIAAIYEGCSQDIIPVGLNTGKYWRKNSILKYPGTCYIEFLAPMTKNLSKVEFMDELIKKIESSCC